MKAPKSYSLLLNAFVVLLLSVFVYIAGGDIFAQKTKQKLQDDKKKLQDDIAYTNKLLAETKKSKLISLNQLIILNNKVNQREDLIDNINSEIGDVDEKIASGVKETTKLNAQLKQVKEEYAKMIVFAYKNRNAYTRLMFLFASADFNEAYMRMKYLQQLTRYRQSQSKLISKTATDLSTNLTELKTIKSGKTVLLKSEEDEKTALALEKTEKNASLKKLQAKEAELLKTLKEKEKESKKLQASITSIIAAEIKKAADKVKKTFTNTTTTTSTTTATTTTGVSATSKELGLTDDEVTLSQSFVSNQGKLPWPLEKGVVTSTFGVHPHPVLTDIKVKNDGIDISTDAGAKARAVFDGKVTGIINIPGANKAVIVRHGEYLTVYSNLSEVYVSTGDKVKTKQSIGLIYTDTDESKTELKFEVWYGKTLVDPLTWLSAGN
jgi:murein hydrolase activator